MKDFIIKNSLYFLKKLSIFVFWILIWQIAYLIIGRDIYVPSPFNVFLVLKDLIFLNRFWISVGASLSRVLLGLIASILIGLIFGVICGLNDFFYEILNPFVVAIKATPVMSFIIVAIIWFSSSGVPIFICFLMCFPIIWTSVVAGIKNVDSKLLEMSTIYNVSKIKILKGIYLPTVAPFFKAAVVTSLGLGWKVSVAAEVLSHPRNSIGSNLHSSKAYLDTPSLFAWTIVVITLSIIFEMVFSYLLKKSSRRISN